MYRRGLFASFASGDMEESSSKLLAGHLFDLPAAEENDQQGPKYDACQEYDPFSPGSACVETDCDHGVMKGCPANFLVHAPNDCGDHSTGLYPYSPIPRNISGDSLGEGSLETIDLSQSSRNDTACMYDSLPETEFNNWIPLSEKENAQQCVVPERSYVLNSDFLTLFSTPRGDLKPQQDFLVLENQPSDIYPNTCMCNTSALPVSNALVGNSRTSNTEPIRTRTRERIGEWLREYHYAKTDSGENSEEDSDVDEILITGKDGLSIKLYGRHNREKLLDSNRNKCDRCISYHLREKQAQSVTGANRNETNNLFFSQLPLELAQHILSYFSIAELGTTVALVCKEWRDLAYDPIHWQNISLYFCQNLSGEILESIIHRASLLKTLCLHGRAEFNSYEMDLIGKNCPLLERLDVGFITDLGFDVMKSISDHCSNLKALNVEGCIRVDDHCIASSIPYLPQLSDINLSHCTSLSDESLVILSKQLYSLEKLNIDGIAWISDAGIESLVQYQGDNLTHIDLDGVELSDAAIRSICRCKNLQRLSVSFGELLTGASLESLQFVSTLRELRLKKCGDLSAESLKQMFSSPHLSQMSMLDLSECSTVDDECVFLIIKCCGVNLKHLGLGWCWNITDMGLEAIVSVCRKMEFLDLLGIDKITGSCFERLPHQMPKLTYLDLRNCNQIDDELVMSVVRKKPDLRVINYYGEEVVCISEGIVS